MDYRLYATTALTRLVAFDSGEPIEIIKKEDALRRSPASAWMLDYWDQTDDIVEGFAAVKAQGKKYLPKFEGEPDDSFKNRLEATKFTNIYRDTVEGLASKPFEEQVTLVDGDEINIPEQISELQDDVDGAGNNLTVFASHVFFNGINSAIDWIFVDYPKRDPNIKTMEQMRKAGIRPFWSHVLGRNVLDARSKVIAGNEELVYIKILEPGTPDAIRIFERNDNGIVTWSLYQQITDNKSREFQNFELIDNGIITIGVIPIVPFITGRRDGRSYKIFPPMRDAADLQIELYQQESALKFAKIMTAYPMLSGTGVAPEKDADGKPKRIPVGPGKVLYAPVGPDGKAGSWSYVEPSAQSLTFLASDVKDTIQQLRELGRQPLTAQSGNLTVITTAVAAGKAKSAVGAWGLMLKDALENAFVLSCKWLGIKPTDYEPQVYVYDDYDTFMEGNSDLEHLRSMRATGDLSQDTLWQETKRRRVLSAEFDPEQEKQKLLEEMAGGSGLDGEGNNPPPIDPNNSNPDVQPGNVA